MPRCSIPRPTASPTRTARRSAMTTRWCFPVKITPERDGEPIELKLAFAYGLCKDLCIPNDVSLSLTLEPNAGKGDAMLLQSALALVPKPARAGLLPEVSAVEAKLDGPSPLSSSSMPSFPPARPGPISSSTGAMSSFRCRSPAPSPMASSASPSVSPRRPKRQPSRARPWRSPWSPTWARPRPGRRSKASGRRARSKVDPWEAKARLGPPGG